MHRESGYECYKEPEGVEMNVRKAIGIHLYGAARTAVITSLMRAVTLGGQNTMIQWRSTFIRFFFFFDMQSIQTVFACSSCLAHRQHCLPSWSFMHNVQRKATCSGLVNTEYNTMLFCGQAKVTCSSAAVF